MSAMELSRNRAGEVKNQVLAKYKVDAARLETVGRGWEEPAGKDADANRRRLAGGVRKFNRDLTAAAGLVRNDPHRHER